MVEGHGGEKVPEMTWWPGSRENSRERGQGQGMPSLTHFLNTHEGPHLTVSMTSQESTQDLIHQSVNSLVRSVSPWSNCTLEVPPLKVTLEVKPLKHWESVSYWNSNDSAVALENPPSPQGIAKERTLEAGQECWQWRHDMFWAITMKSHALVQYHYDLKKLNIIHEKLLVLCLLAYFFPWLDIQVCWIPRILICYHTTVWNINIHTKFGE